jgi:uncharacterized protein (TIGR02284 family)
MSPAGARDTAGLLLDLLEICKRRELGFRAAAEGVEDPPLRRLLESYAEQRAGFAGELSRELSGLGAEMEAPVRGWSREAGGLSAGDESAIIAECARDEDTAMRAYRRALGSTGAVVERQYRRMWDARHHLRLLVEARAGAA